MKSNLLKSIFISLILLVGATSAWAANLYLLPNSNWTTDNARFAAYFFGNGEKWVSMSETVTVGGTKYYKVAAPSGYPNVIFCRMNPSASANNWNNKWNQTGDLTVPTNGQNLFSVPSGAWDGSTTTWGNIELTITYKDQGNVTFSGTHDSGKPTKHIYDGGGTTLKNASKTGYTFEGWYKEAACTNKVTSLGATAYTANITLYAKWTENTYNVTISAGTGGTVSPSGSKTIGQVTETTVTATPDANYEFVNWTATGGVVVANTSSASTTITATAAGTLKANFRSTATNSLTVEAGTGIESVTGSEDPVTLGSSYSITATPKTGYTFSTWTANPAANATFASATTANTTVTVKNGSVTVTATGKEQLYALTTANSYSTGNPGYTSPTKSRNDIGVETTAEVTATAAGNGYTFTGWTLTNCIRTDGGADNAATITIRANGNGAAMVTANYTAKTLVRLYYYNDNNWSKVYAYIWDPITNGNNATWPGVEITSNVEEINCTKYYYCEYYQEDHPGWSRIIFSNGSGNQTSDITYDATTNNGQYYIVDKWVATPTVIWTFAGTMNDWDTNTNPLVCTSATSGYVEFTLDANTEYKFKFVNKIEKKDGDTWYGVSSATQITYSNRATAQTMNNTSSGSSDQTMLTAGAGVYRFTWDVTNKKVTVTYPTSYTVTYSRTPTAAADAPTTSPSVTSGKYVAEGTSLTFTAKDAKTGYRWKGWYDNSEGTGTALSTDKAYERTINDNTTIYAVYTTDTYNITYTAPTHGTFTIQVGSNTPVNANTTADYKTTITLSNKPATGYHFVSWNITPSVSITNSKTFLMPANHVTIGVTFAANTYKVKFYKNADDATGSMSDQSFTYDEALKALTANAFTRTGYNFSGWNTNADGTGTTYTDGKSVQNLTAENEGTVTLYAQWTAKTYPVTLQHSTIEGYGSGGTSSVTATYGDVMPSIPELPTAQNGYAFMGYFDQKDGKGTQYYNAKGTSAHVWDKVGDATLYAYFKKAEITINLNAASFEPNSATPAIATATITPTPVGTTSICWELLYNDDTPVAEHDPQETGEPNQVQFNINDLATGTYQIKATLREGAGCTGTIISHATQVFTITSDHTITIKYVDENGQTIKASTTQSAHVSSLTEITAPPIIGYTFKEWEAGDGVSIKDATDGKKNTATIEYNAYYDGYLKATYTKNSNIIYFYNTLGWENVYVYFYSGDYWNGESGTGTQSSWYSSSYKGYAQMTRMGESNIWYVNAADKATTYLVFGKDEQDNYGWFSDTEVIRRGDYNSSLPMFVPVEEQDPEIKNNTRYYNKGYWMNYPDNSGYTLDLFNHHSDNDPARYFVYPYSKNTIFPLQLEVEINAENVVEGNKKIWFRIHRNDGKNFGGDATNFPTVNPTTTGGFIAENDYKVELITPIAGTYTFILDYTYNDKTKDYQYRIDVDYPAAVGDYRILYSDAAVTNWSGNTKPNGWYHPSRVIKKGEDRKDIISFYINKDVQRRLSYQTIKSIDNTTGAITWNTEEIRFDNIDWSKITKSGVYNFTFVQDSKGISVESNDIVPYEGNYYIRTDAMGGGWEDYKTNSENRMTYSSFSESDANSFGEKFSHYAVKWCKAGTNVKFTIANDYSQCISDTLAQDIIPLGNLTDEGTLLNNDIYDANIRFMWNRKTNKISRAYVGPAGDKQSQFLMLQSCSEFKDAAGNDLNPNEGDILDKEKNIYAARFTDTQNWIYERTIQVKPRTRVKLYASYPNGYHIYIENNTSWKDVALYAWKDGGNKPLGDWPGIRPTRTVVIDDKTYYDFPVNKYVFGSKLIFNNTKNSTDGGQQKDDYQIPTIGDYYLTASSSNSQLSRVKFVSTIVEAKAQYFRGEYAEGSCADEHTIQILGGDGDTWNTIRVIYDFKTNRLMAAWMPNNTEIDTERRIESDVMIIRDHQNPAQCITFANDSSKLTKVKTVYGVMRFNRWILNNRGGADNLDIKSCTKVVDNQTVYDHDTTNLYHPVLTPENQKSQYERALYFISFPFDVHLSDVFGFGTYGQHWIIEYYDGLKRAREGYWIDSDPNWKYVTDPSNFVLEKYKGYILCLNLGKMAYDNTDFWAHNISQVELFFPSTTTMEEIAKAEVTMPKLGEEYLCKINRGNGPEGDRTVKDSYWRCIGVPSYANYSNVLTDSLQQTIQWQTNGTLPFLYKWNKTDNTLTPLSTTNFEFETMHAYLVQNGGEIHWSAVNATPDKPNAGIIAKVKEITRNYEWRITLTQGEKEQDQAFVRLSDNEQVTTEFDFGQDLSKEFNYGRSDIYTLIGYEKAAANSLPISEQTTVIPLGLSIEYNGDYTLAMPDRVNGIGVTLVDNQTGTRTNLSAGMDYTLTLNKGDYNNRFFIEISPVQQTPTDIEYVTGDTNSKETVRKVLIDNILYIIKDNEMFDARGVRVQ